MPTHLAFRLTLFVMLVFNLRAKNVSVSLLMFY